MQTLLYYPNVNPPRAVAWQALLYWDELATIVPPGYDFKQRLPSGALAVDALAERGLYKPIHLDAVALDVPLIQAELVDLLTQPRADADSPPTTLGRPEKSFLYYGKIPGSIERWLIDDGYVEQGATAMYGPKQMLHTLLAVFARHASSALQTSQQVFVTETDSAPALADAFRPLGRRATSRGSVPALMIELGSVLPVPHPETPLEAVLELRKRYADERDRCRVAVLRLLKELRVATGDDEMALRSLARELEAASGALRQAGRARRVTWVSRSLIVAAATAATVAAAVLEPTVAAASAPFAVLGGLGINLATHTMSTPLPGSMQDFTFLNRAQAELGELRPRELW